MTYPRIHLLLALTCIGFVFVNAPANAQSQGEMNAAAAASAEKADKELTATCKKLRATMKDDPKEQEAFDAAEKAWLVYRDREAEFEAASDLGGSIYPMSVSNAAQALTEDRTKALKVMLKNSGT